MKAIFLSLVTIGILSTGSAALAQSRTSVARFRSVVCAPKKQNAQFVNYKGAVSTMTFEFVSATPRTNGQRWNLDYIYQTKQKQLLIEKVGTGSMTEAGSTFKGTWEEGDTQLSLSYIKEGSAPNTFEYTGTVTLEQDFAFDVNCTASI